MANFIEKRLPKGMRDQMSAMIAAALGLFLGLQYNEFINELFSRILPDLDTLWYKAIVIIVLTVIVVYATFYIERALDGR